MTEFGATATEQPKSLAAVVRAIRKSPLPYNITFILTRLAEAKEKPTVDIERKDKTVVSQPRRRVVKYDSDDDDDDSKASPPAAARITKDNARVENLRVLVKVCQLDTDEVDFKPPTGGEKIKTEIDNGDSDLIDLGDPNEPAMADNIIKPMDGMKAVTEAHDDKNQPQNDSERTEA